MDQLIDRPGYAWALFLVAAGLFYAATGSGLVTAICLVLESVFGLLGGI
jgi:hypothetical protein